MVTLLVLVILFPLVGAVVALIVRGRASAYVGVGFSLVTMLAAVWSIIHVFPGRFVRMFGEMPWLTGVAESRLFGVAIDPLSSVMLGVATVIGFLVVLYSSEYLTERNAEHQYAEGHARYYAWLLLFMASMAGIALSPNLLQLIIFWELTSLCSWALISHTNDQPALRAGFKALIMTHAGGLFYLLGLCILVVFTKQFGFDALSSLSPALRSAVFILFLIAAWAKAAQIPFHTWLPDAMVAPTPISAYLHAAAMVKAGVYLTARIVAANSGLGEGIGLLVAGMAMLTMFMALMLYFLQDDLKKLLAYSTIAHLSYIFLGISLGILGSSTGFQGGVLHIINHAVGKSLLFLTVGAIAYATGSRNISELGGLARFMPVQTVAFFVGAFTVTGVPPFASWYSKFMIFTGSMEIGGSLGPILLVLVLSESVISFAWFLWIGQKVFLGTPSQVAVAKDPPPAIDWTLIILIAACLAAPLAGIPLVRAIAGG